MALVSLYSIAQLNKSDEFTGLIEDVTQYSPEFFQIPAVAHAGTQFKTVSRTVLPSAQFRGVNTAVTASASQFDARSHEMFFLDVPIVVDEAAYKANDGVAGDLLYIEAQGALQSAVNTIGQQTWYGTGNDVNGFPGVRSQLLPTGGAATAVTASAVNNSTTAYALWLNPQGVTYAVGKNGEITFPNFTRQYVPTATAASNGTPNGIFAYVSNISAYVGLTIGSINSCFGITGITEAAPLTDKLGAKLMSTVPLTRRAGITFFMNRTAHYTLQASRTAINYQPATAKSGTPAWSPPPLEIEGHAIVLTDCITNTENNT